MEDTDLSWRVRLAGARILYVPDAVVYHNYRLRFGKDKIYYQERNRYLMLLKCLRWSTLLILLPALVLAEAITWGFSLLRDTHNWINKLRAYAWILHNWRAIMQERRRVQRSRVASDAALLAGISPLLAFEQADSGPLPGVMHRLFDPLFVSISQSARLWVRW
jgi:GT2 family glycosyltransferase